MSVAQHQTRASHISVVLYFMLFTLFGGVGVDLLLSPRRAESHERYLVLVSCEDLDIE